MSKMESLPIAQQELSNQDDTLMLHEGELATYALAKVIEGEDKNPQLRHILATGQEIVTD